MNHNHPSQPGAPLDWNLPISLDDTEALGRRLDAAGDTNTVMDAHDARTAAQCLSHHLGSGLHSAIRQLSENNSLNAPALRAECLAVRLSGDLPPGLQRWAAWLITYAAHAVPPTEAEPAVPANGDALDVYLTLPDIDPHDDALLEQFGHAYCGSYPDMNAVLDGVTDVLEWENQIREFARHLGCEEFIAIDREAIEWHLRDGWDVIPRHGRLHVFFR